MNSIQSLTQKLFKEKNACFIMPKYLKLQGEVISESHPFKCSDWPTLCVPPL